MKLEVLRLSNHLSPDYIILPSSIYRGCSNQSSILLANKFLNQSVGWVRVEIIVVIGGGARRQIAAVARTRRRPGGRRRERIVQLGRQREDCEQYTKCLGFQRSTQSPKLSFRIPLFSTYKYLVNLHKFEVNLNLRNRQLSCHPPT